jgi:hypothetical protein
MLSMAVVAVTAKGIVELSLAVTDARTTWRPDSFQGNCHQQYVLGCKPTVPHGHAGYPSFVRAWSRKWCYHLHPRPLCARPRH